MHLVAAVFPPASALEEACALVGSVPTSRRDGSGTPGRSRRSRRREASAPPPDADPSAVFTPTPSPYLLVAKFGNVSVADLERLAARLEVDAATWPAPLLRVEGADLEASAESGGVRVNVGGDTTALADVVRGVQEVAARTQLFVDRRIFRPSLEIGTLPASASEEYAAGVLAALQGFVGSWWWQSHVSLISPGLDVHRTHAHAALKPRSGPL